MTISMPPLNGSTTAPRVPFVQDLAVHGDRLAVVTADGELSYTQLAERVQACAERLGTARRLVLIAGVNRLDSLVTYLAALSAGHVALLATPAHAASVAARYDPDVVAGETGSESGGESGSEAGRIWRLDERRRTSMHDMHPDLALLMSTSGSTGSPKLVRLSHENVRSNAESIATYLGIRGTDRAATALPMHYCYGLSVINSHLARGAGIILTDLSVVDGCFWELFRQNRGTTFPGVPHTFDLLDRVGFADMDLPHLRYLTQAGGRLSADRVRYYAELGRERGWDLFVMYGQTEATARMAYLPPDLAAAHPDTIGVPIPGGSFTLRPLPDGDGPEPAELVYEGPNVMLGYAQTPADLSLPRTVTSLRTGDLARRTDAGLYQILGRRGRFVKLAGLRVDLQHVETLLADRGVAACCAGRDGELAIAVEGDHDPSQLARHVADVCTLPPRSVRVCLVERIPRLASGKPDYEAVLALPGSTTAVPAVPATDPGDPARPATTVSTEPADAAALRDLYARVLHRPDATEGCTFVSLGGDSLSYVEMSIRLEEALGHLPSGWHTTPIRDLAPRPRRRLFAGRSVDTSVLLRAAAIVAVVGTHAGLFTVLGGAHALLAVAGFNFARFRLGSRAGRGAGEASFARLPSSADRRRRLHQQLASIARIAVPSMLWIALATVLTGQYGVVNVFLLNGFLGSDTWTSDWHFWFVEILVYILVGLAILMAIPPVDRLERRFPFGFAVVLVAFGMLTRFELVELSVPYMLPAFWLFALGWAAARAATVSQRLLLTAVTVASVPGFFDNFPREAVMIGAIVLLLWTTHIPCPAMLSRIAGVLASASLYIYLVHWQVYPHLVAAHPGLAVFASLIAGIVLWRLTTHAMRFAAGVQAWIPYPSRPSRGPDGGGKMAP
ncbi:AMP-binding protein [Phytoactinopolyspora endophytica]|uniref:AMP-binding protein n=1 Tax=Phytoactinopolyspora endophytica TaxID=1642495 RepID=UPI00197C598B|nr:AMP-binding protein [Phytoactinopolyspora endophytica]